jgi:hypothetical protein
MGTIKLTITKVRNIRNLYRSGNFNHQQLADKFKVSRGHITKVINNKRWDSTKYPQI